LGAVDCHREEFDDVAIGSQLAVMFEPDHDPALSTVYFGDITP